MEGCSYVLFPLAARARTRARRERRVSSPHGCLTTEVIFVTMREGERERERTTLSLLSSFSLYIYIYTLFIINLLSLYILRKHFQ